jgi:3'-phosphoadenosine 5'-phosphosulfate sulfotransferase (PAPS reductase)/FAD synthetase
MDRLAELESKAIAVIQKAVSLSTSRVIAFSGGKDAIVVAHMCGLVGIRDAVCETSFYMEKQKHCVIKTASDLGLNARFMSSLSDDWLRKHREIIFSNDTKIRSWTFSARQQSTVKKHANRYKYDCQIFGRRTQENSVKSTLYKTEAGLQCHPIRDWTEKDVWDYFAKHGIRIPWIYGTRFGQLEGNAPFYTLKEKDMGSIDNCWALIESLDPKLNRERFA